MDNVLYFFNKLKMDSKIPYARFAAKNGTPANYQIAIDQLERDEIRFEKFLRRLRSIFQEILVKPLYIQMCLDYPELAKDRSFKANIGLNFNRDLEFEEQVEMTNLKKKGEFITSLADLKIKSGEEDVPYFDNDFLIQRFLGMSPDQLKLNEIYKENEEKSAPAPAAGQPPAPAEGAEAEEPPQVTL
jgi:hypothetical protein